MSVVPSGGQVDEGRSVRRRARPARCGGRACGRGSLGASDARGRPSATGERGEVRVAAGRTPTGGMPRACLLVADLVGSRRCRRPRSAAAAAARPAVDQLLHGEHQRAVAEQHGHRPVGRGDRRAEPGRQAVAERGEAGRVAELPRRRDVEEVHGAEVGDLRAVAGEHRVGGQRGPHGGVDLGVGAGVGRASSRQAARSSAARARPARGCARCSSARSAVEGGGGVAVQRDVGAGSSCAAGPGRCRPGSRCGRGSAPAHRSESPSSVPTTSSASLSAAAVLQRAQPDGGAHRERVRLGERALAVDGGRDRGAERLGQRASARPGASTRAAPGDDHRVVARRRAGRPPRREARPRGGRGAARCAAAGAGAGPGLLQHVERDLDVHRAAAVPARTTRTPR